jgi:hypothetical protein
MIFEYYGILLTRKITTMFKISLIKRGINADARFIPLGFVVLGLFMLLQCEAFAGNIKWNKNVDIGIDCFYGIAQSSTGIIAVVGEDGVIKTSADGIKWKGIKSGTTEKLKSITWANDRFIACGEGVILTSYVERNGWRFFCIFKRVVLPTTDFIAVGKVGAVMFQTMALIGDVWMLRQMRPVYVFFSGISL